MCLFSFNDGGAKLTGVKFMTNIVVITSSLDGKIRAYDTNKGIKFREI